MEGKDGSIPSVKPDYEWQIDSKRKMWVYMEQTGVAMILVEGRNRYYQLQEPDRIINALFEKVLKLTIENDELKNDLDNSQKNVRTSKLKGLSLLKKKDKDNQL